jgi:alkyl sulfatase BDS1-like metallo-beta-lactamase superfamily hydrolase
MRNSFLSAAKELRSGTPKSPGLETGGPDMINALTTSQWWDAIAIRVDSKKADGINFKLNFITPDNGETLVVEMSNGTLTNIIGFTAPDADATFTINRSDLVPVMLQQTTLANQLRAGKAQLSGDPLPLSQLSSTLLAFDPLFEIMPGTHD